MLGAAVPEAAIDVHDEAQTFPNKIGLAPQIGLWPHVHAIADSSRMENASDE
jgi:hypothetical protein